MEIVGEILPGSPVEQYFEAASSYLSGVSVLIATYLGDLKSSNLIIELIEYDTDLRILGRAEVFLDQVYDNSFVEVFCLPQELSKGSEQSVEGRTYLSFDNRHFRHKGVVARLIYSNPISESPVPPSLEISLLTQCNLNCTHCISRETRKTVNRLPPSVRSDIANWVEKGWLKTTYTDFSGDILWADSRRPGELDFFLNLSIPFHLDTSATHMTPENIEKLVSSRVTSINVSIDAARDATYRSVRRGAPALDKIFENMKLLSIRRDEVGRADIRLSAAFVLMRSNVDELPEFVQRVADVGFERVGAIHMQVYTADMESESLWYDRNRFNEARMQALDVASRAGIELSIDRPFEDVVDRVATSPCDLPWRGAYLLGNGDVWACCVPGLKMGNVLETPMEEIWNGPSYQNLRLTINSEQRPPSCQACPFNRKTNNPLSYMPFKVLNAENRSERIII